LSIVQEEPMYQLLMAGLEPLPLLMAVFYLEVAQAQ